MPEEVHHESQADPFQVVALLLVLALPACERPHSAPQLEPLRVQLKWVHQAQFAGFYLAKDRGLFAEQGLDVTLVEGGPEIKPLGRLLDGSADLAVGAPEDLLLRRAEGQPLVAVATLFRKNPLLFVSLGDSGIHRPQDFRGKRLSFAGYDGEVLFLAMMAKLELDVAEVELTPYDYSYAPLYAGTTQVYGTYSIGGMLRMEAAGHRLNRIWPSDYGVHFYSDTLVATEATCALRADVVTRFLRAALEGWELAVEQPEAAVKATLARARQKDPDLQTRMLKGVIPLVQTGTGQIGEMQPEAWEHMAGSLNRYLTLPAPTSAAGAFDPELVRAAYRAGGGR